MTALSRTILSLMACAVVAPATRAAEPSTAPPAPAWKPLFNGHDLSNWDVFVATPDGAGPLVPNLDPKRVFQVGEAEGGSVIHVSGEVYPNTKPPGHWNNYEIVCRKHDYSVRMNGKLINTWTDATKRARAGFIGLQNYNDQKVVRHRNVRIKKQLP